jgi:hypothetical protein
MGFDYSLLSLSLTETAEHRELNLGLLARGWSRLRFLLPERVLQVHRGCNEVEPAGGAIEAGYDTLTTMLPRLLRHHQVVEQVII